MVPSGFYSWYGQLRTRRVISLYSSRTRALFHKSWHQWQLPWQHCFIANQSQVFRCYNGKLPLLATCILKTGPISAFILNMLSSISAVMVLNGVVIMPFWLTTNNILISRTWWLYCPLLTKGSNWQITQIWESCVFTRLDFSIFYFHSEFGAETLILLRDI